MEGVWGFDVKCHSTTSRGTNRVLQEDPRGDWNVICVGLRLLLALLLTWHCQRTEDGEGSEAGERGERRGGRGGLFLENYIFAILIRPTGFFFKVLYECKFRVLVFHLGCSGFEQLTVMGRSFSFLVEAVSQGNTPGKGISPLCDITKGCPIRKATEALH